MSIAIGLYFVLAFCVFCGLIYEVKTRVDYYEYQTEKDVLKMFSLALFWPLTLVYIVVMLSAEQKAGEAGIHFTKEEIEWAIEQTEYKYFGSSQISRRWLWRFYCGL